MYVFVLHTIMYIYIYISMYVFVLVLHTIMSLQRDRLFLCVFRRLTERDPYTQDANVSFSFFSRRLAERACADHLSP